MLSLNFLYIDFMAIAYASPKIISNKKMSKLKSLFSSEVATSSKQGGFTLIELLVVIGLIAVLASIVLIAINPARQFAQARNAQRMSHLNSVLNALGQYMADHKGDLPTSIDDDASSTQEISNVSASLCADLVPLYIPALPQDPKTASGSITNCAGEYLTSYYVNKDAVGRLTISAPNAELGETLSLTR